MTKDIMLRISGVQFPDGEENSEEMEVITSGSYFEKDGPHLEDSWSGSPQHIWMSAKKKTALMCR